MSEDKNIPCDMEAELPLLLYQGELEREERERLRSHLATCARCEEAFSQLETTAIALDGAMVVPRPTAEQWRKLKENVLARVAAPVAAGDAPPSEEPCESIEEDLLVLGEVGPDRRRAIDAHLDRCAPCREARSAFGSIGHVLDGEPLEWPSIARWDALKENVLTAVQTEVSQTRPVRVAVSRGLVPWRTIGRVAAGVVFLVGVSVSVSLLRGPTADDVRRQWQEAQNAGTLDSVTRSYEQVLEKGMKIPQCLDLVDDAAFQLVAIHRFQVAYDQRDPETKRIQLLEVMLRFPSTRATELALSEYNKLVVPAKDLSTGGFEKPPGDLPFDVDTHTIQRYTENLERQFASVADIDKKRETELRGALSAAHYHWGLLEREDRDTACNHFKKAIEYAPNSQAALDASNQLKALRAN